MRKRFPLVVSVVLALVATEAAAQGRATVVSDDPCDAATLRAGVTHPTEPMFLVDAEGWPIQGDSGFVSLRDEGRGFVYATWFLDGLAGDGPSTSYGTENWGQIETFACLARALREYEGRRHEDWAPVRISHISGRYGGFPDLTGRGYASHVSHQTGNHVNVLLLPSNAGQGRIEAQPGGAEPWNREGTMAFLDTVLRHGAFFVFTNEEVVDVAAVRVPRFPELMAFPASPYSEASDRGNYIRADGVRLMLFQTPRNHADHLNIAFSPSE